MLTITATFPDGNVQTFGRPEDLLRYMNEEGYVDAQVNTQYIFNTVADMHMTLDDVLRWISMKAEQ